MQTVKTPQHLYIIKSAILPLLQIIFFYKDIGENSLNITLLHMLWHVKEANNLIRSKDFTITNLNRAQRRHCLSFTVSEISIFKDAESDVNLLSGTYKVPEIFLKRFSRYNFDGFCLGILFTNRIFNELVLGLSWRGNPLTKGVGGICQSRVRMKSDNNAYSFNALFISLKSSQEHRIPLRMGVLNLVHELLHSFGARHDPEPAQNPSCVPKDKWINGRYLMSKYSNDGHKLNHEILSPCTEMAVIENLKSHHRTKCLTLHTKSICGDGIVQNEECDCGTTFQCVAAKSCCIPHEGFKNSEACTLHKVKLDNCTLSNVAETSYIQIKTPHPKNQRIIY
ncbi:disintegrin and metalloproteinase domain-containing protein 10-like [Lepeophtheirus salmonis]|uniref:disintegrin and metalloproteinase domain-containing protein 10-like n=1 Tax=Lepeophtheirus salmonis TaxID=72036 RepID=UPI003AF39CEC